MYSLIIPHLYTPFCTHHPKSSILLSPYIWPPLPSLSSLHPFPSGNHHSVVCSMSLLVLFVAFCFISYIWVKSYSSNLFPSDLFHLARSSFLMYLLKPTFILLLRGRKGRQLVNAFLGIIIITALFIASLIESLLYTVLWNVYILLCLILN